MSTYGQQLYEAFSRIKNSTMSHLKKGALEEIKPHEFFMLTAIINFYKRAKLEAESLNDPPPPGVKISEISRCTSISMPGVSQTISHLVKQGYVKRITTEKDRRLVYVSVTPKGECLESSISKAAFHLYDEAADILGPEDTKLLVDLLDRLSSSFSVVKNKKDLERKHQ